MNILAIETATEACSAALIKEDDPARGHQKFVRFKLAPREHTKLILPMLDEVVEEAGISLNDVDAIAFGRGPGAFTGLRIAAGIVQGVALSVGKPVVPVSTLAALAQSVKDKLNLGESIIVALDARMDEVYWGEFTVENGAVELVGEEQVMNPQQMLENLSHEHEYLAIGNGWEAYFEALPDNINLIKDQFPSAEFISELALDLYKQGKSVPAEEAQPVYIRNNVAKKSQKKNSL